MTRTTLPQARSEASRRLTVAALAALASLFPSALAYTANLEHTHPEVPQWKTAREWVTLICVLITQPIYWAVFVLLLQRRKMYPIAGRGATFLIASAVMQIVTGTLTSIVSFAYPTGFPCGMYAIALWSYFPFTSVMLLRGYILVFRVEIMNFLQELAWRQKKRAMQLDLRKEDPNASKIASVPSRGDSSVTVHSPVEPVDPTVIPGYFYLSNRKLMSTRWLTIVTVSWYVLFVVLIAIISLKDIDVKTANKVREAQGLPDDTLKDQYSDGAFWIAPNCIIGKSIKIIFFEVAMAIFLPLILWIGYRLQKNTQRMAARTAEQASVLTGGGGSATASVRSGVPAPATGGVSEMDDLRLVKNEFLFVSGIAILIILLLTVVIGVAGFTWMPLAMSLSSFCFFCGSVINAVYESYVVSRKQRAVLARARNTSSSTRGTGKGKLVALIPHHRPLYRLQYVLHDAHCYPVLLAFLQREYSSENALFFHAATKFALFCRGLEHSIAGWTSVDDEASSVGTSATGTGRSGTAHKGGKVSVVVIPPQPQTAFAAGAVASPSMPAAGAGNAVVELTPILTASGHSVHGSPSIMGLPGPAIPVAQAAAASATTVQDTPQGGGLVRSPSSLDEFVPLEARARAGSVGAETQPAVPSTPVRKAYGLASATVSNAHSSAATPLRPMLASQSQRMQSSAQHGTPKHRPSVSHAAVTVASPLTLRQAHERASKARSWLMELHMDYLKPAAMYEVNIEGDLNKQLTAQVNELRATWQPTPLTAAGEPDFDAAEASDELPPPPPFPLSTLYRPAVLAVFNLIDADSFRRFLLTPEFMALLQRADDKEMAKLENQSDLGAATDAMLQQADAVFETHIATTPMLNSDDAATAAGPVIDEPDELLLPGAALS